MPTTFSRDAGRHEPTEKIGKGHLDFFIPIAGVGVRRIRVYGGPFHLKPAGMPGICLREQMIGSGEDSVHFPIQDFSVPDDALATQDMLSQLIQDALSGNDVYVGCAAGQGRTGLVLALLVKAMRITDDPVGYVREHYFRHAVETAEQSGFVGGFQSDGILESAVQKVMDAEGQAQIMWKKPERETYLDELLVPELGGEPKDNWWERLHRRIDRFLDKLFGT